MLEAPKPLYGDFLSRSWFGLGKIGSNSLTALERKLTDRDLVSVWGYNNKGEVVQANHNNNAFDKSYDFDGIGNRKSTSDSLTLPAANNYVSNALNQYSNVNGVARSYDEDGNSTTGVVGTKGQLGEIKWNGNNRLTEVTTEDGKLVKVDYDHMGRRFRKSVTTGGETKYSYFIYSGYNAIAKYTGNSQSALSLQKSYYWGLDLGGGEGTGGMLAEVSHGTATESLFTLMDGNGNITEYLKSDGTLAAHFEYDSFGNTLVSEGAEKDVVDYGFSSRAKDKDLGLVYYNYRYYNAVQGGWINRDPIEERGGVNIYGFVGNSGINAIDRLGLELAINAPWGRADGTPFNHDTLYEMFDARRNDIAVDSDGNILRPQMGGYVYAPYRFFDPKATGGFDGNTLDGIVVSTEQVECKKCGKWHNKYTIAHFMMYLQVSASLGDEDKNLKPSERSKNSWFRVLAHELNHVRAMHRRTHAVYYYYTNNPPAGHDALFDTEEEAKAASKAIEGNIQAIANRMGEAEAAHTQGAPFYSPSAKQRFGWNDFPENIKQPFKIHPPLNDETKIEQFCDPKAIRRTKP